MKKLIALLLCMMMIFSIVSLASAAAVSKTLTSTTTYVNALSSGGCVTKSSAYINWNAPFNGSSSNKRVVVRIYKYNEDSIVSATWVYSGYSTTPHPYKTNYKSSEMNVFMKARVDNRDQGPITISGTFNQNVN